ncbi:MAG: ParB/RepB/Spo0J family partition protein [Patescibacteria group bacterium]|nr:ParB/RepB/Spo0J family partition protein [Patescibacteria group bacterium]MCL5431746.1 ParB/RepB/Spo0J family partition protein [Patescibacteria group bacterium]
MSDSDQITYLDINNLQSNPLQPRGLITPESLVDLVDSIREHGILEPLVVAETPAGYQLIAGERRWRASKIVGLTQVPCIIKKTSHRGMLEMALVENVQRVDLNPLERAQGFKRMMDEFGLGTAEIAQRIGKSQAYVSNSLRLLTLPDALKDALLSGIVTEGHIRALAGIEDPNEMVEALRQILREGGSVRRAEELSREYKAKAPDNGKDKPMVARVHSEEMVEIEKELSGRLAAKVKITQSMREASIRLVVKGGLEKTTDFIRRVDDIFKTSFPESATV